MSCPYEEAAVMYARLLRDAVDLLGKLHNEYTCLAAEHGVVPDPAIGQTMDCFAEIFVATRLSHPVIIPEMLEPE